VTPDVLIPRPETEFVVVSLLDLARQRGARGAAAIAPGVSGGARPAEGAGSELTIADVGTGSGILAICAAKHLPNCRVAATDISPAALEVARFNAAAHGVAERIEFLVSDLWSAVPAERQFDFILSNPPYVTSQEMLQLPASVRDHEPSTALDGGASGTDVIAPLLVQSAARLAPDGWLILEISPMLHAAVERLFAADASWAPRHTVEDFSGHVRVVQAQRK